MNSRGNSMPNIKEFRARLRLSQEEFGVALGVSGRTVRNWESQRIAPSRLAQRNIQFLAKLYPKQASK